MEINKLIDRAIELKTYEADLAAERREIEDQIAAHVARTGEKKLIGQFGIIAVQQKTKDTWNAAVCKNVAGLIPPETFAKLFRVTFAGQKREITKFLAETDRQDVRDLLRNACTSEEARPYFKYEAAKVEEVA